MTDNPVEAIRNLLGHDVVLLPIPAGEKGPRLKGWQGTTLAAMSDPDYLARLNHGGNIGVLLGKPSNGLCSVDVDDDADMEALLELNPKLRTALRTRRARGGNIWIRVKGEYPALTKIACRDGENWGEWRADGGQTVIHGAAMDAGKGETAPLPYTRIVDAPPAEIEFSEINWPPDLDFPPGDMSAPAALALLENQYGPPYYRNDNNSITLNESYWAGMHALEHIILYESEEKAFYEYNPLTGLYAEISADSVKGVIRDRMLEASRKMHVPDIEKKRTDSFLTHVINHLKGIAEKCRAFANRDTKRIHLANGVLVFREDMTVDLMPFSPQFYSRNQSPIPFDESARCDRFLNELLLPAIDPEDVALIQKYMGLCLLGWNLIQRLLILDGEGGRGKTQLSVVVQNLVGLQNVSQLRTEALAERFETYRFLKKTLLAGVDVPAGFLSTRGAGVLKGLVGGDWLDAEQKGGNGNFQFQGTFCVLITSNARLRVRLEGDLSAWRRRLLIVRYEAPPPAKKIPDFGKLLIDTEGPGILNWALDGLRALLADVQNTGDIALTERQIGTVDSLLAESDSLRNFLADCVENAPDQDLTVAEIVEAYAQYCPAKRWKPMPITLVHDQLEGLMLELFGTAKANSLERHGKKGHRGFRRVRLKNVDDQPTDARGTPEELF